MNINAGNITNITITDVLNLIRRLHPHSLVFLHIDGCEVNFIIFVIL